jgi:hypothetical protein
MSYLTGFLPVAHGVACYAALKREADAARAAGDPRTRGQIMADLLVQRLTGKTTATGVDVQVQVVMTDTTLLAGDHTPARITGYGPVPAALARQILREAHRAWLRRLYLRPTDGTLVAMDSRGRGFDGELRELVIIRDEICRTPWCDAPVRHIDHVRRAADGGETSTDNGQGLCEACNYAKEAPGWSTTRLDGAKHQVITTTPTGHSYISTAPDPPGTLTPPPEQHGDLVHFYSVFHTPDQELQRVVA